jgi:hypothetical protein
VQRQIAIEGEEKKALKKVTTPIIYITEQPLRSNVRSCSSLNPNASPQHCSNTSSIRYLVDKQGRYGWSINGIYVWLREFDTNFKVNGGWALVSAGNGFHQLSNPVCSCVQYSTFQPCKKPRKWKLFFVSPVEPPAVLCAEFYLVISCLHMTVPS